MFEFNQFLYIFYRLKSHTKHQFTQYTLRFVAVIQTKSTLVYQRIPINQSGTFRHFLSGKTTINLQNFQISYHNDDRFTS
jgi:hypothetical protein